MRSLLRWVLSTWLLASTSATVHASEAATDTIADNYAVPDTLVSLRDGRTVNVRCSGEGTRGVLLEAGGNADSGVWFRVQPRLANAARVCAYDRAGHGFSDQGPLPRDLDAYVTDLSAIIEAAGVPVPVVLVGHSLGSNIVRGYAQAFPTQVAGMVLVDPPEQGSDELMQEAWQIQTASQLAQRDAFIDVCEEAAVANDVDAIQQRCLRAPPPWMGEPVASAMLRNKAKPSYWRTLRSELAQNIHLFSKPVPPDESYGSIPIVLLHAAEQDGGAPDDVRKIIEATRRETHARILAASTHSVSVEVPDSSHDIHLDQPEAVVSAVLRLLATPTPVELPREGN
jgi:pimeloyl-ACP methyl ester carboxylesterase